MKITPGRGKGGIGGSSNPVLIFEDKLVPKEGELYISEENWKSLLYGWSSVEKAEALGIDSHHWHFMHGISVDVFAAYLQVMYRSNAQVQELLETRPLTNGVLMKIDRLIQLSLGDAEEIQRLQQDDESGKIEEWVRQRDSK